MVLLGQAIILGVVQGITEFLPISSSGHLIILPLLFNWEDQGLVFDAFLHIGTLCAVVTYFRSDLYAMYNSLVRPGRDNKQWRKLGLYILLATFPAALMGLLFKSSIETTLRDPMIVAGGLVLWAGVLLLADQYSAKVSSPKKTLPNITFLQSFVVGFWQVIALIPGTSRSGITMTGGMLAGMNKQTAVRYSFLLSIPVILGAGLLSVTELMTMPTGSIQWMPLSIGFVSSFLSGYMAIAFLLKLVARWGFAPFAAYRLLLAIIILLSL